MAYTHKGKRAGIGYLLNIAAVLLIANIIVIAKPTNQLHSHFQFLGVQGYSIHVSVLLGYRTTATLQYMYILYQLPLAFISEWGNPSQCLHALGTVAHLRIHSPLKQ